MENLTTQQKIFLFILGIIVIIILILYIFSKDNSSAYFENEIININQQNNIIEQNNDLEQKDMQNKENKKIIIHIAGQVQEEGIVQLEEGARIYDAIDAAGGLTKEADLSQINLATQVKDGQKIYIPSLVEIEEGYMINYDINNINEKNEELEYRNIGKININNASQSELETISGIGPSTALKIINYRKENGKFTDIEDIKNVPGIGDAKFESIKDSIVVN